MSDTGSDVPPADARGEDGASDDEFNKPSYGDIGMDDDDDDSLLSEVDEAQFADFDATAVQIAPDLETLNRTIKPKKRKRVEGEDADKPKKKKEGTREKVKRNRRRADSDDGFSGGEQIEGKRSRKSKSAGDSQKERKRRPAEEDINEDDLPPEERRRRALDRAMDAALKKPSSRRIRKGEIDLDAMADQEIKELADRMRNAAQADADAVMNGQPASAKLRMLPEVLNLLNRNTYVQAITDPDSNILESVRFFLEPLSDGSLPAYNIQRELFAALAKLPMKKETLIASGIGKVIFFYKKSKRPEPAIKRQATKLMEEWSRPILQRSDDYTKRVWETVEYDASRMRRDDTRAVPVPKAREGLAPGQKVSNRARILPGVSSYTIVPKSVGVMPRR